MKIIDIEAFVLKKSDYGEGHRVLTLFTKERGKINATIRGIKKSRNREIYASDPLIMGIYTINKKENSAIINKLSVKEPYMGIKKDYFKLQVSFYLLKVVDSITFEEIESRSLYKLLSDSLAYLERSNNERMILIMLSYFLYKICIFEGMAYEIKGHKYFDLENGKIIDDKVLNCIELNDYQYRYLYLLNKVDINTINELQSNNKNICTLIKILEKYINFNLHLGLKIHTYLGEEIL